MTRTIKRVAVLAVATCAAALLSLPLCASAGESIQVSTPDAVDGDVTFSMLAEVDVDLVDGWELVAEKSEMLASGTKSLPEGYETLASFRAYPVNDTQTEDWNNAANDQDYTCIFDVGSAYEGATLHVYVDHHAAEDNAGAYQGEAEELTAVVTDGRASVTTGLAIYTVAVDTATIGSGTLVDDGDESPETGLAGQHYGLVALVSILALCAAGYLVYSLRRKAE